MKQAEPQFTFDQLMSALRRLKSEYGVAEQEIRGYCREICDSDSDHSTHDGTHLIGWLELEVARRNDIDKDMRRINAAINTLNRAVAKWNH